MKSMWYGETNKTDCLSLHGESLTQLYWHWQYYSHTLTQWWGSRWHNRKNSFKGNSREIRSPRPKKARPLAWMTDHVELVTLWVCERRNWRENRNAISMLENDIIENEISNKDGWECKKKKKIESHSMQFPEPPGYRISLGLSRSLSQSIHSLQLKETNCSLTVKGL